MASQKTLTVVQTKYAQGQYHLNLMSDVTFEGRCYIYLAPMNNFPKADDMILSKCKRLSATVKCDKVNICTCCTGIFVKQFVSSTDPKGQSLILGILLCIKLLHLHKEISTIEEAKITLTPPKLICPKYKVASMLSIRSVTLGKLFLCSRDCSLQHPNVPNAK